MKMTHSQVCVMIQNKLMRLHSMAINVGLPATRDCVYGYMTSCARAMAGGPDSQKYFVENKARAIMIQANIWYRDLIITRNRKRNNG